ncbi:MAG: GDP-mannose 4,6-dehydratase [Chlamydiia bacterium]|nr:GDP-mannose 4,6-dehydratase [Chlamydiia bacterium]
MTERAKVLVIGSNSFSGSDFIDLLMEEDRYHIVGVSRSPEKSALALPYKRHSNPSYQFVQIDLNTQMDRLAYLIDSWEPEYVVNFAAQSEVAPSWEHPGDWFKTNAVAMTELADILKQRSHLKRYVHISLPEVYGTCVGRVTESAPLNPSTPYAASKAAGDLSLSTFAKNYGLPLVMIRATNVYGAHQQLFKIIPRSVIYLRQGRRIQLHGGGRAVKSYIHIRDVSRGEHAAMLHGRPGEIYHLSPDRGYSVRSIVENICLLMGKDFDSCTETVAERLGQDAAYVIDSTKAREAFGWAPQIDLETGLHQVVEWVHRYWTEIESQTLEYVHKA